MKGLNMKLSLLQLNPIVGDLEGNAEKIIRQIKRVGDQNPDLIVTSELALSGYPPRDLLLQNKFIKKSWECAEIIAQECKDSPPVLLGLAEKNEATTGRPLFNVAALLQDGMIRQCFHKTLLPTYDVFDEDRYFEPALGAQILRLNGQAIGISICEDIWNDQDFRNKRRYQTDPIEALVTAGVSFIINISASPFIVGKQQIREKMLGDIAAKYGIPLVYVNQTGGNDDLIFDGRSCAFNSSGTLIARALSFQEDSLEVNLSLPDTNRVSKDDFSPESEIWRALVTGTRDYVHKTGFRSALVGLSGGIDSALVAAIAAEALGKDQILGVLMPSPYSSKGSVDDAMSLAANLGIRTTLIPITPVMEAYDSVLAQEFVGRQKDLTEENLQARIRGTLLMALSNKNGSLLLTTGNKSEVSVGYCTLYGDMCGAIGVISDVPKSMVYRISRWLNDHNGREIIPDPIITKPPSAELRPDQTDQDSLPPYDLLDEILYYHIELHESPEEIIARGYSRTTTYQALHLVKIAEFKRRQAAPGFKVTDRAFGTGWRMPIAAKEWFQK